MRITELKKIKLSRAELEAAILAGLGVELEPGTTFVYSLDEFSNLSGVEFSVKGASANYLVVVKEGKIYTEIASSDPTPSAPSLYSAARLQNYCKACGRVHPDSQACKPSIGSP